MCERFVNEARFGLSRVLSTLSSFGSEQMAVLEVGAGPAFYPHIWRASDCTSRPLNPWDWNSISLLIFRAVSLNFVDGNRLRSSSFA
jgi:hypothetical protein